MNKSDGGNGKQEPDGKKQIVLVVDGRPMRQFYTSIFLQRLKYHVIMAKTAEDAQTFLALTVPLAIIVNIDLPQTSGAEFLKQVRRDRRTRDVPVIIYTSNKDAQVQRQCEEAGCAAYLRHPATLEELYVELQKATNRPRRFVRLDTFLDVTVGDGNPFGSPERKDSIAALSELGMFVTTKEPLAYGSIHPFTFCLPNAPGWVFRVEGQIVYRHLDKDMLKQAGMGVKFLKVGNRERDLIKDFIREKLMDGIATV